MPIWDALYFPPEGDRKSPISSLKTLLDEDEQNSFLKRIRNMRELEMTEWSHDWRKRIGAIYQLTAGDFRAYYGIRKRLIVIVHICRKVGRTARPQDLSTAERNLIDYDNYQGGR